MSTGEVVAITTGGFALAASVTSAAITGTRSRWRREMQELERRVDACDRDRLALRRNIQLVIGAIVGLIPEPQRLDLLHKVAEDTMSDVEHGRR